MLIRVYIEAWIKDLKCYRAPFIMSFSVIILGIICGFAFTSESVLSLNFVNHDYLGIMRNNLTCGFQMLIYGLLSIGIYALVILFLNGYQFGHAIHVIYKVKGKSAIVSGILPHFFIEIIGLACFGALSFTILIAIIKFVIKNESMSCWIDIVRAFVKLMLISVAAISIAAIVEGFVSTI